jgi:hypothetical protein
MPVPALKELCIPIDDLSQIFATMPSPDGGADGGAPSIFDRLTADRKVIFEVALYPAGGSCPEESTLIALGRSAVVDLATWRAGSVPIPLGCRVACATGLTSLEVQARFMEDSSITGLPAGSELGDIATYATFEASKGICSAGPPLFEMGQFRRFPGVTWNGTAFNGPIPLDLSEELGCLAVRMPGKPESYACLEGVDTGRATAWRLKPEHLTALAPQGAAGGALLIQFLDSAGSPLANSTVNVTYGIKLADSPPPFRWRAVSDDWLTTSDTILTGASGAGLVYQPPTGSFGLIVPMAVPDGGWPPSTDGSFDPDFYPIIRAGIGESSGSITTVVYRRP